MARAPATTREFRVLWYEVATARAVFANGQHQPLPRSRPTRREVFSVRARSIDGARAAAREYVTKRLPASQQLQAVNVSARTNELIIYTSERRYGQESNQRR